MLFLSGHCFSQGLNWRLRPPRRFSHRMGIFPGRIQASLGPFCSFHFSFHPNEFEFLIEKAWTEVQSLFVSYYFLSCSLKLLLLEFLIDLYLKHLLLSLFQDLSLSGFLEFHFLFHSKGLCLTQSEIHDLLLQKLFLQNFVAELKEINAVNEVVSFDEVNYCLIGGTNCR